MAADLDRAAQELLPQPGFAAALCLIESRLAERQGGPQAAQPAKPATQVTSQEDLVAQVAAEIKEQQRQRQEAVDAYNTAADGIIAVLEQSGGQLESVPAPLLPAATMLLRFYHADAGDAGPAPQLSREVQVLLNPASRAAVAAHLTDLHQRAATKQGPFLAALPPEALGEGVTPDMLPGGRTCRLLANADGSLVAGLAAAPAAEVPGLPGGPLNLQTLAFGLAVAERQVGAVKAEEVLGWLCWGASMRMLGLRREAAGKLRLCVLNICLPACSPSHDMFNPQTRKLPLPQVTGLHPLSLLMLDADGQRFVACSVCGHVPCLEHAHMRLVSRQLAVSSALLEPVGCAAAACWPTCSHWAPWHQNAMRHCVVGSIGVYRHRCGGCGAW